MYLSLLSVYVGAALMMRTLWALLLLPLVIAAVHYLVIRKEEQYLQRKFGETFLSYKAPVRRRGQVLRKQKSCQQQVLSSIPVYRNSIGKVESD